ncbi:MAG: (Fe-S)-binding protein [Propionibacteriales bacterium]|nr:(Fe-S)-binding protein [Propionibacteriales bacterium]
MQVFAVVVSLTITFVAVALFARAIGQIVAVIKTGQPTVARSDNKAARWAVMAKETLGHTRMLQWSLVGSLHWFVFVGFGFLFLTLVTAFGQLFDPEFALPFIGHWIVYDWATEAITWLMLLSILGLTAIRLLNVPTGTRGRYSRFSGSRMWQGYFVEAVIGGIGLCILILRGAEYALAGDATSKAHFPLTFFVGEGLSGLSAASLESLVYLVAMIKIVISFTWMIVLSLNTTMGVAWHRFTAWPNIWFKREPVRHPALGALQPMMVGGKPIDFADIEELDEDTVFGVGKVEDFTWKGLLDFTSCTECGRCQSQCPAWNTEKPLSPKLFVMGLREHAYAKAPFLLADEHDRTGVSDTAVKEAERPLIGDADAYGVIDPDVLWSCTSCGACVQQCPVDIEHVDHIMDMRRYQVLVESNFPAELNQLFKGLENKGNPWNMSPNARMDWTRGLPFEVLQVGTDVESLDEVEWLFWVGCAGAYEDRAKKTTRAVAELLHEAGVTFAVLGDGETCTGDPARRSGNEFVYQQLAMQNTETLTQAKARKVVSTCAHCFNTLKNEYGQLGVELEVVHHTQLLNRLVREGRLTPVAPISEPVPTSRDGADGQPRLITYHDPCFLGRHNQVYEPPRELLSVIPGAQLKEMPRHGQRSFCCGAGGARMWMEEKIGERINLNRTKEAVATGATQIAVGCPFCRVMMSDGLTSLQADGAAREDVEVLDVAQLLLASVRRSATAEEAPVPPVAEQVAEAADESPVEAGDNTDPESPATADETEPLKAVTPPDIPSSAAASDSTSTPPADPPGH